MFRIGNGYDVHKLSEGESLILGGVEIPHNKGTVAHSDGDVLIHAIIDALLGAAALKDIGYWFPDNDNSFKNIDSKILLKKAVEIIGQNDYFIVNIDSTIAAQKPKLKPFIDNMCEQIAKTCNINTDQVSVKATTTEKLGFEGREEGISAYAVVLISKNDK
ncbi:MAG: 2-C-methyl-D-erythritol 2,4-cyclodiphosphate synthase [Bacteroidales bacterium]|nr:2-C-methyl-D-erythritol 2,4-cyclodiphosphate synthase [Bacteroidales bacterium]